MSGEVCRGFCHDTGLQLIWDCLGKVLSSHVDDYFTKCGISCDKTSKTGISQRKTGYMVIL